ncbi:MAG: glycosyltransferase [Pseudomonadota bacterium]
MQSVTILIPTRHRPEPLARALKCLAALDVPAGVAVDVLVVDNAREAEAAPVVEAADLPFPARTVHEPRPGVSSARNTGVEAATGALIAFVDDDCAPGRGWLAAQLAALAESGADASFGPRIAQLDAAGASDDALFLDTYSRDLGAAMGADVTADHARLPLPGAVFVKARCLAGAPFDPRLDAIGGEDVLLFRQLAEAGRRFVWAPEATMVEFIPKSRLDARFILKRRFVSGQHRCLIPMMLDPPRRGETAQLMAKGALAVALAGPVAAIGRLSGRWPVRATGLLMSGLGRLTWWRRGSGLYGEGHR